MFLLVSIYGQHKRQLYTMPGNWKVLDFFLDDGDSCALTVYSVAENKKAHVIADADEFKKRPGATYDKYVALVSDVRNGGATKASSGSQDSGIDVSQRSKSKSRSKSPATTEDAEEALQSWMLEPLHQYPGSKHSHPTLEAYYDSETAFFNLEINEKDDLTAVELESNADLKRRMSKLRPEVTIPKYIRDLGLRWYEPHELTILNGSDSPPPYHPTEVRASDSRQTLFFKAVDSAAPQVTKRELSMLSRLAKDDFRDRIRAPRLLGLVASDRSSHTKIMGFLQSEIRGPTPLTNMLDSGIPQDERDQWAKEAESMKEALHEKGLVWGDAKADNFLVDSSGDLWMIDMGGSYTEGWIDPEIQETEEGDDMGVDKVVNALHDPEANTTFLNSEGAPVEDEQEEAKKKSPKKRLASHVEVDFDEDVKNNVSPQKKQKHNDVEKKSADAEDDDREADTESDAASPRTPEPTESSRSEPLYCYCKTPSKGRMIACDNEDCIQQWFHFECAGLEQAPPEKAKWFCAECAA